MSNTVGPTKANTILWPFKSAAKVLKNATAQMEIEEDHLKQTPKILPKE